MTLAQQMVTDVDDIFLNTDEHAETITYAGTSIIAVVDRGDNVSAASFADGRSHVQVITIWIAKADVAAPAIGDAVVIDSLTYRVNMRVHDDGGGMHKLILHRVTPYEQSSVDVRIQR